jgi:superoxide reductase
MKAFGELYQTADWKKEKHAPVIECADEVKAGETLRVTVSVGREIPHPNTTEHHIRWIAVYFQAEGDKFPYEIGRFEFSAHGEGGTGPNTGPAYTQPEVQIAVKLSKPGAIHATSFCNLHGLWAGGKEVKVT